MGGVVCNGECVLHHTIYTLVPVFQDPLNTNELWGV